MPRWLTAALDYVPRWLEFQLRYHDQPGCVIAVAHRGELVLEQAFGYADLAARKRLTPRHRFRVASHSKTFAAACVLRLVEARRLRLSDPAGRYVAGLHPGLARVTVGELLSHSAGVVRDGPDSGQFVGRRPFLSEAELRRDLAAPPVIARSRRFKYSNHGYGLLGLVLEALSGEPYRELLAREVIEAARLRETLADGPPPRGLPLALGHSARLPLGRRIGLPGDYSTRAIAPAAGVVSTAADLVRFFSQLAPGAKRSLLSPASRRAMLRRRWRDPDSSIERHYGLGMMSGRFGRWRWFGHSGGLQGYITRTCVLPDAELALSVLTNAVDGAAHLWLEGTVHILRAFAEGGAPPRRLRAWSGRWWTLWNPIDLVPVGDRVLAARPDFFNPFLDAQEVAARGKDRGSIVRAPGFASHGEPARLVRDRRGRVVEVQLGGTRLRAERSVAREMARRYKFGR